MCGTGESHKLGLSDTKDRETPVLVEALADVPIARVACGKYHSAALTASGDVYAWGLNDCGQLGLGQTKATTPAKVEALSGIGVTQLSCGEYHTLALTDQGEVLSFGHGEFGRLGHGDEEYQFVPKVIEALRDVRAVAIAAGHKHSMVLTNEGEVLSFGRGQYGQLGHGYTQHSEEPQMVEELQQTVVWVACGGAHTVALCHLPGGPM